MLGEFFGGGTGIDHFAEKFFPSLEIDGLLSFFVGPIFWILIPAIRITNSFSLSRSELFASRLQLQALQLNSVSGSNLDFDPE